MPITLDDIAKHAGVTKTAVSEVLRDRPSAKRFRPETRERILASARELNYRPNFFATQLLPQNRRTLMLGVTSLSDTYSMPIANGFELAAAARGYTTVFSVLRHQPDRGFYERTLGDHGIPALAVVAWSSSAWLPDELLERLAGQGVLVVTVGREVESASVSQVSYDNQAAVRESVDYLLAQGARRFWLLGELAEPSSIITRRCRMAREYLSGLGLPEAVTLSLAGASPEEGARAVRQALGDHPVPDAVLAGSDTIAWGCNHELARAGHRVGTDVATLGFNDTYGSAYMSPSLTSVRIPGQEMGRLAADLLIDGFERKERTRHAIKVDTELVIRESGRLQRPAPAAG